MSVITTAEPSPAPTRPSLSARGRWLAGLAAGAALLVVGLPAVTGVPWASTWVLVGRVPTLDLVALVALWIIGLLTHTIALTAALPSLSHRRALTLSLTGSAVANVLPLGGAAGIALNYRMTSHWGFSRAQFATYTVVTNAWDVLAKLALPLLIVPPVLLLAHVTLGPVLGPALVGAGLLAVVGALAVAVLVSPAASDRVGRVADRALVVALRALRSRRDLSVRRALVELQAGCSHVVRTRWRRLSLGMALYTTLLGLLLGGCLSVTHAGLAPAAVLGGFAVERLLTLAGITPGGAGVVEVGLTGALIALGGDPAGVVAGVLLYRVLTYGLEIPVGGAGVAAWFWGRYREQVA